MKLESVLLKEQLKRQKNASVTIAPVNGVKPIDYLKWITYIPSHWNIKELYSKPIEILTEKELEILQIIKREEKVKESFNNFISDEKTTSKAALDVYEYINSISIYEYAKLKLLPDELEKCFRQVSEVLDSNIEYEIAKLTFRQSNSVIDNYILFLLKQRLSRNRLKKLDNEITAQLNDKRIMMI